MASINLQEDMFGRVCPTDINVINTYIMHALLVDVNEIFGNYGVHQIIDNIYVYQERQVYSRLKKSESGYSNKFISDMRRKEKKLPEK